jgi:hypothetical protein
MGVSDELFLPDNLHPQNKPPLLLVVLLKKVWEDPIWETVCRYNK